MMSKHIKLGDGKSCAVIHISYICMPGIVQDDKSLGI